MLDFLAKNGHPATRTGGRLRKIDVGCGLSGQVSSLPSRESVYGTQLPLSLNSIGLGRETSIVTCIDRGAVENSIHSKSYVSDSELGKSMSMSPCYGATQQDNAIGSIDHISESEDEVVTLMPGCL